jgi:hypothetical protein
MDGSYKGEAPQGSALEISRARCLLARHRSTLLLPLAMLFQLAVNYLLDVGNRPHHADLRLKRVLRV